jgi:glucose dehydrogenase
LDQVPNVEDRETLRSRSVDHRPALTAGGLWLAALGGTPYYAIFGATLALAAVLALRNHRQANWVLVFALAGTVIWSLFEAGLRFWDLFPVSSHRLRW